MTIADRVRALIADEMMTAELEVRPEHSFIVDLGADSLDIINLVVAVETAFEIKIKDEDYAKMQTVQDLITFVEQHGGV